MNRNINKLKKIFESCGKNCDSDTNGEALDHLLELAENGELMGTVSEFESLILQGAINYILVVGAENPSSQEHNILIKMDHKNYKVDIRGVYDTDVMPFGAAEKIGCSINSNFYVYYTDLIDYLKCIDIDFDISKDKVKLYLMKDGVWENAISV